MSKTERAVYLYGLDVYNKQAWLRFSSDGVESVNGMNGFAPCHYPEKHAYYRPDAKLCSSFGFYCNAGHSNGA